VQRNLVLVSQRSETIFTLLGNGFLSVDTVLSTLPILRRLDFLTE